MTWWPPVELDERAVDELQRGLDRLVVLGVEVAVVRADDGEVLAAAERERWLPRQHQRDGVVVTRRLWRSAALGAFTRRTVDLVEFDAVAVRLRDVLRGSSAP